MTKPSLPTIEMLHKLLVCDAKAGKLFWRDRTPDMFACKKRLAGDSCRAWNAAWAGKEALHTLTHRYKHGSIFGYKYTAHRVIWAMHYGEWPDQVDHINHDKADNRIENLRTVTHSENARNRKLNKNNTSGHAGVTWRSAGGKG